MTPQGNEAHGHVGSVKWATESSGGRGVGSSGVLGLPLAHEAGDGEGEHVFESIGADDSDASFALDEEVATRARFSSVVPTTTTSWQSWATLKATAPDLRPTARTKVMAGGVSA